MTSRKQFDMNAPGAAKLRDQIVHGAFKTEGQMVAFPLCFPSVSVPIRGDESKITALDVTEDGVVYGGTSGYASHLFVGMFHGVTGMVFDMGTVPEGTHTAAVCCGRDTFFAAVNSPKGGRIVVRELQETPFSLIQEWTIQRTPFTYIDSPVKGERVVHAIASSDRSYVIGATESSVFRYEFKTNSIDVMGDLQGSGKLATLSDGTVIGRGAENTLWRCDPQRGTLDANAFSLPEGNWNHDLVWASDPETNRLYLADADANLYSFSVAGGWDPIRAQIPYAPVTTLAVTFDGRVFGSAGTDMQRMFCYDPEDNSITDIGVGASTLQQRRYCYDYGDAVTGRDGEIIFGENDDLGHLWLYFPRIKNTRK